MDKLIEFVQSLPKWVLIVVATAFVLLFGFVLFHFAFGGGGFVDAPLEVDRNELIAVPDGEIDAVPVSKLDTYKEQDNSSGRENRLQSYFDQLSSGALSADSGAPAPGSGSGLVVSANAATPAAGKTGPYADGVCLDPSVYSSDEIYLIRNGLRTKEQIDNLHAINAGSAVRRDTRTSEQMKADMQAQQDSAYLRRLKMAYKLQKEMSAPEPKEGPVTPEPETEVKKIDLNTGRRISGSDEKVAEVVTSTSMGDNSGIISSLDGGGGLLRGSGPGGDARPVKTTFLKDERLVSGQRVIMRLMDDLYLADGTMIPANTHITGTCSVGSRLGIVVSSLNYGGRILNVSLRVYDNDGTEGIYCPKVAEKRQVRKGESVAKSGISSVAQGIASVFTGNNMIGRAAGQMMNSATMLMDNKGNVTVSVSSGYEFYVLEDVDDNL